MIIDSELNELVERQFHDFPLITCTALNLMIIKTEIVSMKDKITIKEKERKENASSHYFSQILLL